MMILFFLNLINKMISNYDNNRFNNVFVTID